jgi:hypothetical protein
MVLVVAVACAAWSLFPARESSRSESSSALAAVHGDDALFKGANPEGALKIAKLAKEASRNPSSGLGGMNAVELHVRESAFLQQLNRKENPTSASYDLYFLYQDDRAKSRAEVVFRRLVLQSFDTETSRIEILVPERDVATILSLEMMGEYQLVRRSLRQSPPEESENMPLEGRSIPLGDRDWVRQLVGDGSVVVVP